MHFQRYYDSTQMPTQQSLAPTALQTLFICGGGTEGGRCLSDVYQMAPPTMVYPPYSLSIIILYFLHVVLQLVS